METEQNLWWGYKHNNGTYQAKRYWGASELQEAERSDFVDQVVQPFYCKNRDEALIVVKRYCTTGRKFE